MFNPLKNTIDTHKANRKPEMDGELKALNRALKIAIKKHFSGTLKLYILDSGSCGACELELQALFTPHYNVAQLGIHVVYDANNADIMLITGLLTENMYHQCQEDFQKLPASKQIITIGDCPLMHASFLKNFAIKGEVDKHFSTVYHIAGCPPEPRTLMRHLLRYLESL